MLHSSESSLVELFGYLPRLARFTLLTDRLGAAAEALLADGWTGVQILLFGRHAQSFTVVRGHPSFVFVPDRLTQVRGLFSELVLRYTDEGIARIPYDAIANYDAFGTRHERLQHDLVMMPLAAKNGEFGCVVLDAQHTECGLAGLRTWVDILASMLDADLQSTFYGELESLMGALQGINNIDEILQVVVDALSEEFDAACVAWQVDEPQWRVAAIAPAAQTSPAIALTTAVFSEKEIYGVDGMIVVPLYLGGEPWGALALAEHAVPGERLSFLQTVAYHLEVALANALSLNRQLVLAQENADLYAAGRTLLGFTRMEPLARAVSQLAITLVGADEAALYVATDENFARVGYAPGTPSQATIDIRDLERARASGTSVRTSDQSAIVIPLQEADDFVRSRFAAIVVSRSDRFNEAHVRKLESFGALCAMALRNVRLYEEASEANLALSDINAFKDDLLAMFTHDFKGPLTVISGYGELVLEKLHGDERENLSIILYQVKRLATLADDALALARAQAAGFALQIERGELVAFVEEVLRSSFGTQGARITIAGQPSRIVLGFDPIAIRHVLENIIGNALKYSYDTITVVLDVDGKDAVIAVRDTGIGIPAQELPEIFGRFVRASNARRRGVSGSGVGLYLAKRLIEQHGGAISVASIEGEGSTFEIRLPF